MGLGRDVGREVRSVTLKPTSLVEGHAARSRTRIEAEKSGPRREDLVGVRPPGVHAEVWLVKTPKGKSGMGETGCRVDGRRVAVTFDVVVDRP